MKAQTVEIKIRYKGMQKKNINKPIDFQAYSYNFKVDWAGDFCMQSVAERRE